MAKEVEVTMRQIDVIYGPFVGGRIRVSAEVADLAISDGWAVDAYPEPRRKGEPEPKRIDPATATAAAEKAARQLRGEPEPEEATPAARAKAAKAKAGEAKQAVAGKKAQAEGQYRREAEAATETEEEEIESDVESEAEVEEVEVEQDRELEAEEADDAGPMTTEDVTGTYQTRHPRGGRPPKRKG
jgi:hypothetical protein